MLAIERRKEIITIIQEEKRVLVAELAIKFNVTEETIRRDLEKLEEQGILKRTYGGAVLKEGTDVDMPLSVREVINKEGKIRIAERVAESIIDGETIMLDSSSTSLYVSRSLRKSGKSVTLITNSLKVMVELQDCKNINIILAGGNFRETSKSFVGRWTEGVIENYYVNKAIICCKGMDMRRGVMDSNEQEGEVKKAMVNCANEVIVVVDHIKFDKTSFVKIMDFEKIDQVYTDSNLSTKWEKTLEDNKVKINYCY